MKFPKRSWKNASDSHGAGHQANASLTTSSETVTPLPMFGFCCLATVPFQITSERSWAKGQGGDLANLEREWRRLIWGEEEDLPSPARMA
jgi:hypothetical protein